MLLSTSCKLIAEGNINISASLPDILSILSSGASDETSAPCLCTIHKVRAGTALDVPLL